MPLMFLMLLNFGLLWKLLKQALGSFQTLFLLVFDEKSTMNSVDQGPQITKQKQLSKLLMILTVEMFKLYCMEELLADIPHLEKHQYGPLLMDWRGCHHEKSNILWKIVCSKS